MARETKDSPAGEQKLERYGVWVKVEPRTVAESQGAEGSFELTDLETSGAAGPSRQSSSESTLTLEEEELLDELDTELGPSGTSKEPSIPDEEPLLAEDEELPDISEMTEAQASEAGDLEPVLEEELPELDLEEEHAQASGASKGKRSANEANEVEVTLSDTGAGQERFEDLDALESELASVTGSTSKPQVASSEILSRIEDELRSIRADLTQLRSELSGIRKPGAESSVAAPPSGGESQSGFFDEDEDETIALTGDELDNILNTAEITEEAAEAAPVEMPLDLTEIGEGTTAAEPQEEVLDLASADIPLETSEVDQKIEGNLKTSQVDIETLAEDLPAELELEDLSAETATPTPGLVSTEGLPELDLEGIPEIETEEEKGVEASAEPGDLETLDLEEEVGELEPLETAEQPKGASERVDEFAGDVDLDALAAEAQELESDEATASSQDLDLGELEPVTDEQADSTLTQEEIEIPFENESVGKEAEPMTLGEDVLEVEEVPADEEASRRAPAAKESPAAIPDDLKDEIRTVLKYMDHLLEALPDEKIQEFANSNYFVMYKKLFEDLGLGE
jgi:hypothetical protein